MRRLYLILFLLMALVCQGQIQLHYVAQETNNTFTQTNLFVGPFQLGASDTGLSRGAAGQVNVGNGTLGDATGTLSAGKYFAANGTAVAPSFAFANNPGSGIYNVSGTISFATGGTIKAFINGNINLATNTGLYTFGNTQDTSFTRISAANVGIGNGTTGDSSGTLSVLGVAAVGANNLTLSTNGSARWFVASGGAFAPSTDAVNNLGGPVNRAVNGYFSGSLLWTDGAGNADSSIFRTAAATWGFGTGTTANSNGNLIANVVAASPDLGATQNARLQPGGVALGSAKTLVWSSTATATGSADTGLSRSAANTIAIGNGTAADFSGTAVANTFKANNGAANTGVLPTSVAVPSTGAIQFSSTTDGVGGTKDAGLSRTAAGELGVGNGTAADFSGNLKLNKITSYGGVTTVSNGVAVLVAKLDFTAQTANVASTTLYAVPASGAGMYRAICYNVITVFGTTATLPSCQINYTDNETNTAQGTVFIPGASGGSAAGFNNSSFTGIADGVFYAKASTNILFSTSAYASTGTQMQYSSHIKLEYLGN